MEINEPINVWVFFKGSEIIPHTFFWQGRQIKVDKINLIHTSRGSGSEDFMHFSLSSCGNFYRLRLDAQNLKWFIEAVEEDD